MQRYCTTTGFIDDNGHGTFNAGIAGIAGWNGVVGQTNITNIKLIPVKVLDNSDTIHHSYGTGSSFSYSAGINWVRNLNVNGHKVINMRFGGIPPDVRDDAVAYAVSAAWNAGCVLAAAAGNNGTSDQVWPANLNHVISVAASDSTDTLRYDSEYGSWINVAAPGDKIYSTSPTYSVYLKTASGINLSFQFRRSHEWHGKLGRVPGRRTHHGGGAPAGTLLGTTSMGGLYGNGVVYAVNVQGVFNPLFFFPVGF